VSFSPIVRLMMRWALMTVLCFGLLQSGRAQVRSTALPVVSCQTVTQVDFATAAAALLIADVPVGAVFQGAEYYVKSGDNPVWTHCPEGLGPTAPCNSIDLPSLDSSKQVQRIEAMQYYLTVAPRAAAGGGAAFFTRINVRLATKYTMPGPHCTAQAT